MKPQPQRGHSADADTHAVIEGFLRLGVKENWEEAHEAEPAKISLPRERGEEPKAQSETEQGAAAEGKEAGYEGEEQEGGAVGAGDAGPQEGESREAKAEVEAEAGAGGGEDGEKGGEEQRPGAAVELQKAADGLGRVRPHAFTLEQLWELEGVFRRTPYVDEAMQQELARRMGVTQDRIQVWFKRRRIMWRNCRRALRIRDAPALHVAHPVFSNWGGPCNTILIQEPNWVWILLEPMPLEPMPLELTPVLPMPPMLAFLPMPLPPLFLPLPWVLPPSIQSGCPHVALPGPLSPVAFL
ncbi:homeobox protein ESX1-like [Odocoileus virginianus]|uniref:Homeobox protein ESX1-like n=1 Tax=Odocoileus virginianus TaxID=9874 RepID=A0A6J0YUQ9_ODOVR|nr:homeobox protein ESX1-like [Odocoileus virginianus texanus]